MALDHALDLSLKWSQFPLCSFHMVPGNGCTYESPTKQIILRIEKRFLISTCSKDQGHLPLKYKHVTCGKNSSYLHILCSTYLCCVPSIFAAQTRVPLPPLPGHSPLGQELSWKTEIWQPRIFQAGNIPNRETGGEQPKQI